MLLLSSATRILATKHPPTIPHLDRPPQPRRGRAKSPSPMYWSIPPGRRQRQQVKRVSEVNTVPTPPEPPLLLQYEKGCGTSPHPHFTSRCRSRTATTRERFSAALSFSCWLIPSSCRLLFHSARRLARALHPPWPHRWVARRLPPHLSWEFLPLLRRLPCLRHSQNRLLQAERSDPQWPSSLARSHPSALPRSQPRQPFHCCLLALLLRRCRFPSQISWSGPRRLKYPLPLTYRILAPMSVFQRVKQLAVPGPVLKNPIGFLTRLVRWRGAFCSAVIHATAFGSGCGTGAPIAFNRSFASGTRGDSG